MTLDTKDELLLTMLFFGFRRFEGSLLSLPFTTASAGFPSPNAGAWSPAKLANPLSLYCEPESLPALYSSCMLRGSADLVPFLVSA